MKRGAERQITKDGPDDDDDDDDIEEIQDPQGFQKADESALAKRQIRALPKRALAAATAAKPPIVNGSLQSVAPEVDKVEPASQPKFGGFVGFGAGASTSNPFTFTAQPPSVPASALNTTFKTTQSTSSFLGVPKLPPSDSGVSSPKPATTPSTEETDATALKYFKSLRGLNVSFLSAISAAVEKDPFLDVASLVESYKNLRTTIQSEFDGSSPPAAIRGSGITNSIPLFGTKPPSERTTSFIPKSSTEASSKPPPIIGSSTKTSGFTFPPFLPPSGSVPTQSPFGFAPKPSEPLASSSTTPPEPPKSVFAFVTSNTSTPASTLSSSTIDITSKSVPSTLSQETGGSSASLPSQSTSATPSFGFSSTPSLFATARPTSMFGSSDAPPKPTSVFGSSIFGNDGTNEPSRPPPFNLAPSDNTDSSKVTTLLGNAISSSTSGSIFGSSEKTVSVFGSASSPKVGTFAFGKAGGSIGNPVGFGFGGSTPSSGDATTLGSSGSGFNLGAPSTKPSDRLFSPPTTDKSSESTPQPEAEGNEEGGEEEAAKLLNSHAHDEEGEGEEDEETTHIVRCKVYRLSKSEDKSEWKDLGLGMFRLKKHKETNVRRVLMRNSNTGRIMINFRIYGSLKVSLARTSISFIGYDNSTPTSFRVRVKTEEQAGDLKQAMEQEIAAVQAAV